MVTFTEEIHNGKLYFLGSANRGVTLDPASRMLTKLLKISIALIRKLMLRLIFIGDTLIMTGLIGDSAMASESLVYIYKVWVS